MRKLAAIAGLAFVFSLQANSQTDLPKFAVDVRESFVWGEDATAGAESSAIKDPLSSAELRKLKHNGVEVSSRIGFEKPHPEDVGEFIVYSLTIVNSTKTELAVETGGIVVDGHFVAPLPVDYSSRGSKRKHSSVVGKEVVDIRNLNCFASGYLSSEKFLLPPGNSSTMLVEPRSSLTVSGIIRDPRYYPLQCSAGGCFPKGTIRYSIRVGSHEYIFPWNGESVVNCGR